MSRAQVIAEAFDLQRRKKLCNIKGCPRLPSKNLKIFDEDRVSGERTTLANVYLCNHHNETMIPGFMTKINEERILGKTVSRTVTDIGFVTY